MGHDDACVASATPMLGLLVACAHPPPPAAVPVEAAPTVAGACPEPGASRTYGLQTTRHREVPGQPARHFVGESAVTVTIDTLDQGSLVATLAVPSRRCVPT